MDKEVPENKLPTSQDVEASKKRRRELTDEERREERRAANRRSALESRQRRKMLIEDLQKQVGHLTKETTELRAVNDTLRLQLESSLSENQQLRLIISQQQFSPHASLAGAMGASNPLLLGGRGGAGVPAAQPLAGLPAGMAANPALFGGLAAQGALLGAAGGLGNILGPTAALPSNEVDRAENGNANGPVGDGVQTGGGDDADDAGGDDDDDLSDGGDEPNEEDESDEKDD